MAGVGPAPKDAAQRHRGKPARRGEWIDLPVAGPVPKLPRGTWSARTKAAWSSWWSDPASTQWTEADKGAVVELAYVHADFAMGKVSLAAEVRLRMDILGLTQKGKRDLRWRVVAEVAEVERGPGTVTAIDRYRAMVDE